MYSLWCLNPEMGVGIMTCSSVPRPVPDGGVGTVEDAPSGGRVVVGGVDSTVTCANEVVVDALVTVDGAAGIADTDVDEALERGMRAC
jgi:hypothetical protein